MKQVVIFTLKEVGSQIKRDVLMVVYPTDVTMAETYGEAICEQNSDWRFEVVDMPMPNQH